jgi:hypothetical protein
MFTAVNLADLGVIRKGQERIFDGHKSLTYTNLSAAQQYRRVLLGFIAQA